MTTLQKRCDVCNLEIYYKQNKEEKCNLPYIYLKELEYGGGFMEENIHTLSDHLYCSEGCLVIDLKQHRSTTVTDEDMMKALSQRLKELQDKKDEIIRTVKKKEEAQKIREEAEKKAEELEKK